MKGYRIAVVNPLSPFGQRLRALLDSDDPVLPVIELKLFDPQSDATSTLTQFEDEVLVTQALDPDLFPLLDVLFVGEGTSPEVLAKATAAAAQGVLTLVAGGLVEAPVAAVGLNERFLAEGARLIGAPAGASILLGRVLEALGTAFEVTRAQGTVFLPASELGNAAVEELHQQVVQLLNFGAPPTSVIGEQLAFNLLTPPAGVGSAELAIAKEVSTLAGMEEDRVSVALLLAPVFHSYAASLWVEFSAPATTAQVMAALDVREGLSTESHYETPDGPPRVVSPAGIAGSRQVHIGVVRPDGRREGGFWLWLAADSVAVDAAQNALQLAQRLLGVGETLES